MLLEGREGSPLLATFEDCAVQVSDLCQYEELEGVIERDIDDIIRAGNWKNRRPKNREESLLKTSGIVFW